MRQSNPVIDQPGALSNLPKIYIPATQTSAVTTASQKNPQFLFRPLQPKLPPTAILSNPRNDRPSFAAKERHIEKSVCATALANSTFASTIFNLTQMEVSLRSVRYPNESVPLYNALQESLTTAIVSLMQIQKELNMFSNIVGKWS